ncbi:hypothetical protein J4413_04855 [Candidatus Woesearchaeota archaeon]|nr:hypothetical protein [Candidatus Woesearchaeota archaeon]
MAEVINVKKIYDELIGLKKEIIFIKRHMFDPDVIMTSEEARRFEQAMKEFKRGKTTSYENLKKELGL